MKLAFYTYSYIDRLRMEPMDVIPPAARAGYDALDLSATWRDEEDPARFPAARRREIRNLARDHGLTIEALVTHLPMIDALRDGRPINLPGAIELAAELGAPVVTVHIGAPRAGGPCPETERARAVEYLHRCCGAAASHGVCMALDAFFPGFLTTTPEAVVALIREVGSPNLRHNYDPSYAAVCGFDPPAAARLLADHIVHAHIKDHVGRYPSWEHRIPGEGELDHRAWAGALREIGFTGAVAVECFTDMPLDRALTVGHRTVRAALAA